LKRDLFGGGESRFVFLADPALGKPK